MLQRQPGRQHFIGELLDPRGVKFAAQEAIPTEIAR